MLPDEALAHWVPTDESEARSLIRALQARATSLALPLSPAPPVAPDNCCGNGCIGCVWEGYGQEVAWWRDDLLAGWGECWRQGG